MDRQVGARHGIMMKNAMVHYTMFEPYLKWCSYIKHEVEDDNDPTHVSADEATDNGTQRHCSSPRHF